MALSVKGQNAGEVVGSSKSSTVASATSVGTAVVVVGSEKRAWVSESESGASESGASGLGGDGGGAEEVGVVDVDNW